MLGTRFCFHSANGGKKLLHDKDGGKEFTGFAAGDFLRAMRILGENDVSEDDVVA